MSVNERLKEARLKLNLSQSDVERLSGINQKDISRMESGLAKNIRNEYIHFLYKNDINLNFIFTGEGEIFLHNSNNLLKNENLEKYKNVDVEDDNLNDNLPDNPRYDLDPNEALKWIEEKKDKHPTKTTNSTESEYLQFLKQEITFKNKIIDTLLQTTMIKEDIEAKVRKALRKNEDKPLISVVSKVEKEVLKTAKTKEEEQLIADIFVRILTRLSEED